MMTMLLGGTEEHREGGKGHNRQADEREKRYNPFFYEPMDLLHFPSFEHLKD